jgi:hypothetical protein
VLRLCGCGRFNGAIKKSRACFRPKTSFLKGPGRLQRVQQIPGPRYRRRRRQVFLQLAHNVLSHVGGPAGRLRGTTPARPLGASFEIIEGLRQGLSRVSGAQPAPHFSAETHLFLLPAKICRYSCEAHRSREINGFRGWTVKASSLSNGELLTVTAVDAKDVQHINGLGFIGIMASGSHHQPHHLMIAKGELAHGQ